MYEDHTSESHGRCANGNGAIPQLSIRISQRDGASICVAPGEPDNTPVERVRLASVRLVCMQTSFNFPVSAVDSGILE